MKIFNLNGFYPFERHQFENYLNDMAKKGYHFKKFNSFFGEYEKTEKVGYYHIGVHSQRDFLDSSEDKKYIELFESDGYQYIDKTSLFYVFFSQKSDSIYTDRDIEEEMILEKTKREMWLRILVVVTVIIFMFLYGILPPSFDLLTSSYEMIWFVFMLVFLLVVILSSVFSIYYLVRKKADYDYQCSFFRSYVTLFFCMIVSFGTLFLTRGNLLYGSLTIVICPLIAFVVMLLSLHTKQPMNMQKYAIVTIVLLGGLSIAGLYDRWNQTYIAPEISIVSTNDLKTEKHSLILDYYSYDSGGDDDIEYVHSLYENLNTYILDKYLNQHIFTTPKTNTNGYDIYQNDYVTVIYKDGDILTINKDMNNQLDNLLKE